MDQRFSEESDLKGSSVAGHHSDRQSEWNGSGAPIDLRVSKMVGLGFAEMDEDGNSS